MNARWIRLLFSRRVLQRRKCFLRHRVASFPRFLFRVQFSLVSHFAEGETCSRRSSDAPFIPLQEHHARRPDFSSLVILSRKKEKKNWPAGLHSILFSLPGSARGFYGNLKKGILEVGDFTSSFVSLNGRNFRFSFNVISRVQQPSSTD